VTVNDAPFEAVSGNKKQAKLMAAEQAVQWLEETGVMQERLAYLEQRR
jgi:hypothetical protein